MTIKVRQLFLVSSSPPRQSGVPSHSFVLKTHVPSWQANWSGAQVTVTRRKLVKPQGTALDGNTFILEKILNFNFTPLLGQTASSVPEAQSLRPSHTL